MNNQLICDTVAELGLDLVEYYNRYAGPCPIHGGDNANGFCIYKNNGTWQCFTNNCHEIHGKSFNSLLRLLGKSLVKTNNNFTEINNIFLNNTNVHAGIPRERVRASLQFPATYFLDRNYSEQILDKYDVGLCTNPKKLMYRRCVAPIYDTSRKFAIGCTGRTIDDQEPKWNHQFFNKCKTLYNSWFANSYIKTGKTVILVEGAADIWRLEEAGIHCGIAILGCSLSPEQLKLLSKLGAMNIILLLDNDEAGKTATATLAKKLKNLYNIEIPTIGDYEDVGVMPPDKIREVIEPLLVRLKYD